MRPGRVIMPAIAVAAGVGVWRIAHGGAVVATLVRFRWAFRRLEAELDRIGELESDSGDDED